MKFLKTFITSILLFQSFVTFSQSEKEMEAIAKYQLAEEAYSNNEYDMALDYLGQAKKIIGDKPKLLYLQIVVEIDKGYPTIDRVKSILNIIEAFQKSPAIGTFSSDKKMMIAKHKVLLKEKLAVLTAEAQKQIEQKKELEIRNKKGKESFEKFTIDDLPFGLTVEEFQKQYPDIFPENLKISKTKFSEIDYVYHYKNINFENKDNFLLPYNSSTGTPLYDTKIHAIFVKNGKVVGFQKNIFYYNSKGNGDLNYQQANAELFKYVEQYKSNFESYGAASDAITFNNYTNQWNWVVNGNKTVILYSDTYVDEKNAKRWKNSLTIRVYREYK